jgi:hypothetical protein
MLQPVTELMAQLNEKSFELEVMKFCTSLSKKLFLSFVTLFSKSMFGTHLKVDHLISNFYEEIFLIV